MIILFKVLVLCLFLSGCAWTNGKDFVIGSGNFEWYPDGQIKKIEGNSPIKDTISFSAVND